MPCLGNVYKEIQKPEKTNMMHWPVAVQDAIMQYKASLTLHFSYVSYTSKLLLN